MSKHWSLHLKTPDHPFSSCSSKLPSQAQCPPSLVSADLVREEISSKVETSTRAELPVQSQNLAILGPFYKKCRLPPLPGHCSGWQEFFGGTLLGRSEHRVKVKVVF